MRVHYSKLYCLPLNVFTASIGSDFNILFVTTVAGVVTYGGIFREYKVVRLMPSSKQCLS